MGVVLVPAGDYVFILGGWRRVDTPSRHLPDPLFLERSPKDLCLSSTHSKISKKKKSFPYAPGAFQTTVSFCICMVCLLSYLFKGRDSASSHPLGSPKIKPAGLLKFQVLSFGGCKNSRNLAPLIFKAKCLWGFFFSLLAP